MLVQQARAGSKWIACDCLGTAQNPPILTPAFLSEAETYYLRRLTGGRRPDHEVDCPFFRDQVTNRFTHALTGKTQADPPTAYFEVLKPVPEKLAQRPADDGSDDRTRSASVPRLARLLWRLLAVSRLNVIAPAAHEPPERSIVDEFKTLRRAAGAIEIAPGIELGRLLWTHGEALLSRRAFAGIRALAGRWPPGHAPQGFLTLFAQRFQGAMIYPAGCDPVRIENRVQSPSVRDNRIEGPYLVIVVVGEHPEASGYAALRAYAQPVFSGKRFVPIATEFERHVLRSILQARPAFDRAGVDMVIEKPIFDRLTPLGACRPDFLLEARSRLTGEVRQIVIEALSEPSARQFESNVMRACLERIAPVVALTPSDVERGQVLDRLSSAFQF